jgi:small subunit ribosomal protein S1
MTERTQNAPRPELETSFAARTISPGDIVKGTIVKIAGEVAFINYGARSEGYITLSELKGEDGELRFNEGDEIEAEVLQTRGAVQLSRRNMRAQEVLSELEQSWKDQLPVEGAVVAVNKGGYEIRVRGVRAFCPSSQFSLRFEKEPSSHIGQHYLFRITEYGKGKSLVVSRRVLLEEEKGSQPKPSLTSLNEGDVMQGTVTQIKPFGAFVEIGDGIEGLVHVSEISHDRVGHPNDKLSVGEAIEVKILRIEHDKNRVGLSIKALADDPWTTFVQTLTPGQKLTGKVVRIQPFGAFVNIAPGVDGLLHVSGISAEKRIEDPSEVLSANQEIEVVVDKIDKARKRVGLLTPEVAERRQPVNISVQKGDLMDGTVAKVEKFGVFVSLGDKGQALIPNAEMGTPFGTDHTRTFPIGKELKFKIIEVDRQRGRVRASIKALETHDEEVAFAEYRKENKANQSLGSFGDLLKGFLNN